MEEEGFEPPRAVKPLTVFKTVPFSRAWVLLRVPEAGYQKPEARCKSMQGCICIASKLYFRLH